LQQKDIDAIIVLLPTDVSYHSHLDKVKIQLMNQSLKEFATRHNIEFADYSEDPRFSLSDFTVIMPDHLNALGAKKISNILDQDFIKGLR
jgi:hypothetical protein